MSDFHQPRPSEKTEPPHVKDCKPTGEPPTSWPLARAAIIGQAVLESLSGQTINPRVFEVEPQGNRLLVLVDPVPRQIGNIVLPESVQAVETMGQGWVVSAGPAAGLDVPYPGGPHCTPDQLVGRHVFFGKYAGKTMLFSIFDREYKSRVLAMTDRDIWCVDWNPNPLAVEQQFEADLQAHIEQQANEEIQAEKEAADRLEQQRAESVRKKW